MDPNDPRRARLEALLDILPIGERFGVHDAVLVAAIAHYGQDDKGRPGLPYLTHPMRVMSASDDEVGRIIRVLHDAVEDSEGLIDAELLRRLGAPERVVAAITALTHAPGQSRADYAAQIAANDDAYDAKPDDRADNSDPERLALLSPEHRSRLEAKYARDAELLDAARAEHAAGR